MIELIKHFGDDTMIVECARVSYDKQASNYTDEQNEKLIAYLFKNNHSAPFYHPKLQYRITCPIYVERQLTKTSVGVALNQELDVDINSISGRYVDFSDSYTEIKQFRKQSKSSKQGSAEDLPYDLNIQALNIQEDIIRRCKDAYQELIALGVSKEQCRTILPLNLNTTFIWTGSLWALIRLCSLRLKDDAQKETKDIVQQMLDCAKNIEGKPFKHSLKIIN